MKKIASILALLLITSSVFAFQIRNSGRYAVQNSLKDGEIPTQIGIRQDLYLDDFAFPYKNRANEKVSVFVQQEKTLAYLNGDENSVQVAIKANSSDFFPQRDVNYVIFVTNPAFVGTDKGRSVFTESVMKILSRKSKESKIYFYISENEKLALVSNKKELASVLDELALSEKSVDIAGSLEMIANLSSGVVDDIEEIDEFELADEDAENQDEKIDSKPEASANVANKTIPWQVLCVSEQDMFKNEYDEQSFFQLPFSHKNISFAYVGYGIVSDWKKVTDKAERLDVSLYYENTYKSLTNRIISDFDRFSHLKVENLEVRIVYSPEVKMPPHSYKLGNLGVDESHILLDKVHIPSYFSLKSNLESKDSAFNYMNCSVKFEYPELKEDGTYEKVIFYKVYPLFIKYSDDPVEVEGSRNEIVAKNAVLKNSASIYFQVERLVDMNYENQALALIENQIADLEKIYENCKDKQIEVEIENFKALKNILLGKNE